MPVSEAAYEHEILARVESYLFQVPGIVMETGLQGKISGMAEET
jgi:hypothetical protein